MDVLVNVELGVFVNVGVGVAHAGIAVLDRSPEQTD